MYHVCRRYSNSYKLKKKNNPINYEREINNTLKSVIDWLAINNLHVNLEKTNYIQFTLRGSTGIDLNINYDGKILQKVETFKFLGVLIDRNLNFISHIDNICSKINSFSYVFRRLRQVTSMNISLMAYHGYIASVLRYGLIIWGNGSYINRAFMAQKKCLRAMCGASQRVSCKTLFGDLNILTLPSMYIYEVCKFVKQHPHLFKKAVDINPRARRLPNRLVVENVPRTALFLKSSYYMCLKIYNKLPNDIKNLTYMKMTSELYKLLMIKKYYSVNEYLEH